MQGYPETLNYFKGSSEVKCLRKVALGYLHRGHYPISFLRWSVGPNPIHEYLRTLLTSTLKMEAACSCEMSATCPNPHAAETQEQNHPICLLPCFTWNWDDSLGRCDVPAFCWRYWWKSEPGVGMGFFGVEWGLTSLHWSEFGVQTGLPTRQYGDCYLQPQSSCINPLRPSGYYTYHLL
jgi:hypothetical protein